MAARERRDEVEFEQLAPDGVGDLAPSVPGRDAEEAGAAPSRMRSPRSFQKYMPSARTTIFGSRFHSRFGVNGIQYSSSEIRRAVG